MPIDPIQSNPIVHQSTQEPVANLANSGGTTIQDLINYVQGMLMYFPYGAPEHAEWLCILQDLKNVQNYLEHPGQPFPDPTKFSWEAGRLKELGLLKRLEVEALNGQIKKLEEQLAKNPSLETLDKIQALENKVYLILCSF